MIKKDAEMLLYLAENVKDAVYYTRPYGRSPLMNGNEYCPTRVKSDLKLIRRIALKIIKGL